jgi:hypothetical protein
MTESGSAPTASSSVPARVAGDLWAVFTFGDPNARYQQFLARGRAPIKAFLEALILHPYVLVPTEDYLSLTILVGTLGQRAVIEILEAGRLRFGRLRGSIGYVGNGGGLRIFEISGPETPTSDLVSLSQTGFSDFDAHAAPPEEAIRWALGGLQAGPIDPILARLAQRATVELLGTEISDALRRETYSDFLNAAWPGAQLTAPSMNPDRLPGVEPGGIRIYGGPDAKIAGDSVDAVLALAAANIELRMAQVADSSDLSTSAPLGHLLKQKARRNLAADVSGAFVQLREIADVPDIGELVLGGHADVTHLLRLAESRDGEQFRPWFHANCRTDAVTTGREYARLLKAIPAVQSVPVRVLRFLITTVFGKIPILGDAVGALDSFVIDRILRGSSPKYFIENLSTLVPGNARESQSTPPSTPR